MTNPPATASPILALREQATALEAAITLALASPRPKPVHRLRTSTRRIEAQLGLLELLPGLPDHGKPARKVVKGLRKLRRAAGKVRDLDVQGDLLHASADKGSKAESVGKGAAKKRKVAAEKRKEGGDRGSERLGKDAQSLAKILDQERTAEADALADLLHRRQAKVSLALEALLDKLEPARALELPLPHVQSLTEEWYVHNTPAADPATADPDVLHSVRKAAKLARYMAENAFPAEGKARTKTDQTLRFEALQSSGGAWHDLLLLRRRARKHMGKHSPLTEQLERRCSRALEDFRAKLKHDA